MKTETELATDRQLPARDPRPLVTDCCIVGGGPAGAVLALLLARKGVDVTLLEKHGDFDRDFRGDTIHPGVMELMEQIGLAERLLQLRHTKIDHITLMTDGGGLRLDLGGLKTRYPYITFMPQAVFLDFLVREATQYPNFHLLLHADVQELLEDGGVVCGVRYRGPKGWGVVRARLTVGADGRFSRLRKLAGWEPVATSATIDVLWFRLPRRPGDGEGVMGRVHQGALFIGLDRDTEWQLGYIIPKGQYKAVREAGLPALRAVIAEALPVLADRVDTLTNWRQLSLLSVESSMVSRWYKPGLLLIGDAAHVMSPVAGVGINYAIQDAVVAANVLTGPLQTGGLRLRHLAAVQRRREWPTRLIQLFQRLVQERLVGAALQTDGTFAPPQLALVPWVRTLLARFIGFGVVPVRLKD